MSLKLYYVYSIIVSLQNCAVSKLLRKGATIPPKDLKGKIVMGVLQLVLWNLHQFTILQGRLMGYNTRYGHI